MLGWKAVIKLLGEVPYACQHYMRAMTMEEVDPPIRECGETWVIFCMVPGACVKQRITEQV